MDTEVLTVNITSEEYGLEDETVTFRYTEKEMDDQKVERYQLTDEVGLIFSGEKVWRTEEEAGFLGLWTETEEVYDEEVQKRVGYDTQRQSVITEEASWDEFREILQGTDAERYII